jgi:hypothetical protein
MIPTAILLASLVTIKAMRRKQPLQTERNQSCKWFEQVALSITTSTDKKPKDN